MKRACYLVATMLPLIALPLSLNLGCKVEHHDDDHDHDAKIKVDTEGSHKGIEVKHDD